MTHEELVEADRKRRGEPVAWIRKNGFRFIAEIEPQDDREVPLYTAPQLSESCASLMRDKTACRSENGNCDPQPAEPVKVSDDLAHEILAAAQTAPGEWIEDAVERIAALLARRPIWRDAIDEIEALRAEIGRLLDSREREGDRLDWLLARLPRSVIRDLVGVGNDTLDAGEWRGLIDKAACFAPVGRGREA